MTSHLRGFFADAGWPATARSTNLALLFLGCFLVGLSHHLGVEFSGFVIGYSETSLCAVIVFCGGAVLAATRPVDRGTLPIILVIGLLCRLALLLPAPHLSSDIYRYVWDGWMQHNGINPYRYVPGDPHLAAFRDSTIFPFINRRDYAPTIYPPVAQMFFYGATFFHGGLAAMKLAMYAAEAVTVYALLQILPVFHLRREMVLLYAWCPLLIWEVGSSGHLDAFMTTFVVLAVMFRMQNRPVATGVALGAAILTKFYPLLLFPALWRRRDAKMPGTVLAVIVLAYLPYLSVGRRVLGFAGGYAGEEGIGTGSRYFLLALAQHVTGAAIPPPVFYGFCALCILPLLVWAWRAQRQSGTAFVQPAGAMVFAFLLLFSPRYPWYVLWLVPFAILQRSLPMTVYIAGIFYALTTRWAMPGAGMYFLNTWIYTATALAFAVQWVMRRYWPIPVHVALQETA